MTDPKPPDYKAVAKEWRVGQRLPCFIVVPGLSCSCETCKKQEASLAALLERLCGEKDMEWREAFGVAVDMTPMQVADHVIALKAVQLAEAQEEIERLAKINELRSRIINRLPMCPDHRDKFKPEHCQACRAEKAESAIEQARDEGRREQREKDAQLVESQYSHDCNISFCEECSIVGALQSAGHAIREAKP